MKILNQLLSKTERQLLYEPINLLIGTYQPWGAVRRECQFNVAINADNLLKLIDSVNYGIRVYEFTSINRPGDLLHYLWVDVSQLDKDLINKIKSSLDNHYPYESLFNPKADGLSFIDFDKGFVIQGDDTYPQDYVWRNYIDNEEVIKDLLTKHFKLVIKLQQELTHSEDILLKYELALINEKNHPQDYLESIDRLSLLHFEYKSQWEKYHAFYSFVSDLAMQEKIKSISCPYGGIEMWRVLIEAQVLRAANLGVAAMEALQLYGPDEGLGRIVKLRNWGGEVFIPYEGMRMANLIFLPGWRIFRVDKAGINGSLKEALNSNVDCKYLFVLKERDFGELGCANRTEVGGWIFYSMKN